MSDKQIEEYIQHYPYSECVDMQYRAHRCFTIPYTDPLYYIHIDPLNRGNRRWPARSVYTFFNRNHVPPITRSQLAQLTRGVPLACVEKLFKHRKIMSGARKIYDDYKDQLLVYAVFISNMRSYKPAKSAPHEYNVIYNHDGPNYIEHAVVEQLFEYSRVVNYAQLILDNPIFAYCDPMYLSHNSQSCIDRVGTHHVPRYILWIGWACRHVPLGKPTVFNTRGRIPYYDRGHREDGRCVFIQGNSCGSYYYYEQASGEMVTWLIAHGLLFHADSCDSCSSCAGCTHGMPCIRTRAGEPYTCVEISRSYFWQYKILTTFGPAEHARYVQVCKMIYG